MTDAEWESLCDHCGKCCLHKLEDEDTGDVYYTHVICRGYDLEAGACGVYAQRCMHVPECLVIDRENVSQYAWLPKSCAYRLLAEGQALRPWHPLVSGSKQSVIDANVSVYGRVISENQLGDDDLEDHVITWVK